MIGARIHARATEAALLVGSEKLSTLASTAADDRAADPGESSAMLQDFAAALQELIAPNQKGDSPEPSSKEGTHARGSATNSKPGQTNDQNTSIIQAELPASPEALSVPQFGEPGNSDQPVANDWQPNFSINPNEHSAKSFVSSVQSRSSSHKSHSLVHLTTNSYSFASRASRKGFQAFGSGSMVEPKATPRTFPIVELRPSTVTHDDKIPASEVRTSTKVNNERLRSDKASENEFVKNKPTADLANEHGLPQTRSLMITNPAGESKQIQQTTTSAHLDSTIHYSATSKQSGTGLDSHPMLMPRTVSRSASSSDSLRSQVSTLVSPRVPSIANATTTPVREEPKSTHSTTSRVDRTTASGILSLKTSKSDQLSQVTVQSSYRAAGSQFGSANLATFAKPVAELTSSEPPGPSLKTANTIGAHSSSYASSPTRPGASRSTAERGLESGGVQSVLDIQAKSSASVLQSLPKSHELAPHITSTKPNTSASFDGAIFVHPENAVGRTPKISNSRDSMKATLNQARATASHETHRPPIRETRSVAMAGEQLKATVNGPNLSKDADATEFERPFADANRPTGAPRGSNTSQPYELSKNDEGPKGSHQDVSPDARAISGGLAQTVSFGAGHSSLEAQAGIGTVGPTGVAEKPAGVNHATPYVYEKSDPSNLRIEVPGNAVTEPTINRIHTNATNGIPKGNNDSSASHPGATNSEKVEAQPASDDVSSISAATRGDALGIDTIKPMASRISPDDGTVSTLPRIPERTRSSAVSDGGSKDLTVPEKQSSKVAPEESTRRTFDLQSEDRMFVPISDRESNRIGQDTISGIAKANLVQSLESAAPANPTRREPLNTADSIFQRSLKGEPTLSGIVVGTPTVERRRIEKDDSTDQLSESQTKVPRTNNAGSASATESYPKPIKLAEALPVQEHTNPTNDRSLSNVQTDMKVVHANSQLELPETVKNATQRLTDGQSAPTSAISGVFRADNVPASSTPTAQAESVKIVQDATQLVAPARIANLSVENAQGQITHAILREHAGTIDVKIVTSSSVGAQRVAGEIETMRQNFDAAGLRLGHSEVSYQDGGGRHRDDNYKPATSSTRSNNEQETFNLNEVVE